MAGLCHAGGCSGLELGGYPVFWATTTEYLSGAAAAASIALINSIADIAGLGLPPVMWWSKDATQSYDSALIMVAIALFAVGLLGLYLSRTPSKKSLGKTVHDVGLDQAKSPLNENAPSCPLTKLIQSGAGLTTSNLRAEKLANFWF